MRIRKASKRDNAILAKAQAVGIAVTYSSRTPDSFWLYDKEAYLGGRFVSYKELQQLIREVR